MGFDFISQLRAKFPSVGMGDVLGLCIALSCITPALIESWSVWRSFSVVVCGAVLALFLALSPKLTQLRPLWSCSFVAIGLCVLSSLLHAPSYRVSIAGMYFESGTILGLLALFPIFIFSLHALRIPPQAKRFFLWYIGVGGCAALVYGANALFGFGWFTEGTTVEGGISSLIALAGSAYLVWSARTYAGYGLTELLLAACALCAGAVVILSGDTSFFIAFVSLALIVGGIRILRSRPTLKEGALYIGVFGILLCCAFVRLSGFFTTAPQIQEFRPSLQTTWSATARILTHDTKTLLVGVGPARFDVGWNERGGRPPSINATELWDAPLTQGYNYVLTRTVEYGLLLTLYVILLVCAAIVLAAEALVGRAVPNEHRDTLHVAIPSVLFISILALLYPLEPLSLCLFVVFLGALLCVPVTRGRELDRVHPVVRVLFGSVAALLLVFTWMAFRAYAVHEQSAHAFSIGDPRKAITLMQEVVKLMPHPAYRIELAALEEGLVDSLVAKKYGGVQSADEIKNFLQDAVDEMTRAAATDPTFRVFVELGTAYVRNALIVNDEASWGEAERAYVQAMNLSPYHPLPLFLRAQMHTLHGDTTRAKEEVRDALLLKSNYADALELRAHLEEMARQGPGGQNPQ